MHVQLLLTVHSQPLRINHCHCLYFVSVLEKIATVNLMTIFMSESTDPDLHKN